MVLRGWLEGHAVTLTLENGVLTVMFEDGGVLTLDQVGRLWTLYAEEHHFYRSLDGSVLARWTDKDVQQRRRLWPTEADLVLLRASLSAQNLRDELALEAPPEVVLELDQVLGRAAAFDIGAARADIDHYQRVYKPIGILPPDQRLALVLQMTEGCPFNACAFCARYKDRPFHVKSPQELRAHIADVRAYLGDSIHLCQGIFIADANALVAPQQQLVELFDLVGQEFGETQIYTFQDGFSGQTKPADDYAALAKRGLQRVYVGLDSGHDPLLAWLHKPGQADDTIRAVQQIKAGGVDVGLVVMLGVGGQRYAEGHVRDTISALNDMGLGGDDLLCFVESTPFGALYTTPSGGPDPWLLTQSQMLAQREDIVAGLRFDGTVPQTTTCDVCEFIY